MAAKQDIVAEILNLEILEGPEHPYLGEYDIEIEGIIFDIRDVAPEVLELAVLK